MTESELEAMKAKMAEMGEEFDESDDEEMEMDAALIAELNKRKSKQPVAANKKAKITEVVEESSEDEVCCILITYRKAKMFQRLFKRRRSRKKSRKR